MLINISIIDAIQPHEHDEEEVEEEKEKKNKEDKRKKEKQDRERQHSEDEEEKDDDIKEDNQKREVSYFPSTNNIIASNNTIYCNFYWLIGRRR